MSLDLLKEFGPQDQDQHDDPWTNTFDWKPTDPEGIDTDDFGDFELPNNEVSADESILGKPENTKDDPLSLGNTGLGKLTGLSDGSFTHIGSSLQQGFEGSAALREPPSISERHTEDEATSEEIAHSRSPGVAITTDKISDSEGLEDWDDFVVHPIPSAVDEWEAQGDITDAQTNISNQQSERSSKCSSNSLMPCEETAASFTESTDTESTKPSSLVKGDHLVLIPSDIPPPSILLLPIATMFQSLSVNIKNLVLLKNVTSLLPNESKVDQLHVLLSMVRAAARVLAGRKLRWKRDTHLSQSMKIGPANSGKTGGMKLTGLDKAESLREDREAAEALGIWRKQLGRLRAAITQANNEIQGAALWIPDISENMHIRLGKVGEGALTAYKPCILCGLKRDERLERVDLNVEDSFGEWWTDHWGHIDCRIFWERHESSVRQRQ